MTRVKPQSAPRRPSPGFVSPPGEPGGLGPGEERLREVLDAGLERVESQLAADVKFADDFADVTTTYLLNAGGKRMRPMLTLLAAQFGEQPDHDDVFTAASAVELTHLASLYHDDVMDEADLRRGVTAAHLNWTNSVAILAGDLLFARSSRLFARLGQRAIELQSSTFERLVLGQLRETIGPRDDHDPVDHYIQVLADKTGALIASAAQFGVLASRGPEAYVDALEAYGERVGVAFQIADDVIDLSPYAEDTGKRAGTDLRAGVETLPVLLLAKRAETDAASADLLDRIRTRVAGTEPASDDPEIAAIVEELREHPVTAQTRDEAQRWAALALDALAPVKAGVVKHALERFAEDVVARDR
ncbi:polyprenyl synthetase family protein [Pseudoclavibacter endophyticus]|uniref:Polyprenyl synthetase family protein n=1 Tax=Pseudoclavibacter endophyticus TaxID=1778590 RepID=A0A6H9WKK1_9MICO|nr:polyprenyl synthetase family protein [Pseudoclavibacter endophyticus]KAB1648032.1 polyprenyl synthetase family protein [Pseudoclavibacter endophyticus]